MGRSQEIKGHFLPPRPFLYTVDQLASLLSVSTQRVRSGFLWYKGKSVGARGKDRMEAINIAPADEKPEWRVAERELLAWMKRKGFHVYEKAWVSNLSRQVEVPPGKSQPWVDPEPEADSADNT